MKKKVLSVVLLALFVSYYGSTHVFVHTHQFAWGIVTHAHPYTSGAHTHSANALLLIDNLDRLLFVSGATAFYLALLNVVRAFNFNCISKYTVGFLGGCHPLRAPPVLA